jgi:hypothetical protein
MHSKYEVSVCTAFFIIPWTIEKTKGKGKNERFMEQNFEEEGCQQAHLAYN